MKTRKNPVAMFVLSALLMGAIIILLWCTREVKTNHSWLPFSKVEQKK